MTYNHIWGMRHGKTLYQCYVDNGATEVVVIPENIAKRSSVDVSMVKLADGKWYYAHGDRDSFYISNDKPGIEAQNGMQAFLIHELHICLDKLEEMKAKTEEILAEVSTLKSQIEEIAK